MFPQVLVSAATGASTRELVHRMGHSSATAALRYLHPTKERDAVIEAALDQSARKLCNT
jgi:hypothetical protein